MRALALLLLLTTAALAGDLPDPLQTPGAINRDVTQANIHSTICVPGWTRTVRPPTNYTNRLKAKLLPAGTVLSDWELDHDVPLALGGHPRDPRNLWMQSWTGQWNARVKDHLESELHRRTCTGRTSLADAQECIRVDWVSCFKRTIGEAGAMR